MWVFFFLSETRSHNVALANLKLTEIDLPLPVAGVF